MSKSVLITGHRGFVGRNFIRLAEKHSLDWDVTGVDIKDGDDCRDFFASSSDRFDLVVHLAAVVGGRATIEGEPLKVSTDLAIDSDFFQWVARTRPGQTVYFSSSAAYPVHLQTGRGGVEGIRLSEDAIDLSDVRSPDATYGWAKLSGEIQADILRSQGYPIYVFRPFSGYGTDQDEDYPFPAFIARALRREDPFCVWGSGTQVRDFVHIEDVFWAVQAALSSDFREPLNIGTGTGVSFLTLAEMVCRLAGYSPVVSPMEDKPVGVRYRVADVSRLHRIYRPKISLSEGISRALEGVL